MEDRNGDEKGSKKHRSINWLIGCHVISMQLQQINGEVIRSYRIGIAFAFLYRLVMEKIYKNKQTP